MEFLKKHSTQILVHLLFWLLFITASLFVFSKYYWRENPFLQYLAILFILVYANNRFLLPFFVKKKWYLLYVLVFSGMSLLATELYCNVFARCGCSLMKCLSDYLWQSLTPLVFFSFVWMLFRYINQQEEVEAIKQERTEMELKFLKSQINPHVLFNNLNTIYSASIENPETTSDLILMLSDNLKHVLYESNTQKVDLKKELQFIDNYIEFQRLRTEGVKQINYAKQIDSAQHKIAPLLLITLIENAFKHSTLNSTIIIEIAVKNNTLSFKTENAYDTTKTKGKEAIGLQNLEKRLDLLYKNKYDLKIESNQTFKVFLEMELG